MFGMRKRKPKFAPAKSPESLRRQKAAIRDYYAKKGK